MENTVKYNDEFVAPKIEDIASLGIGEMIITAEQIQRVKEYLEIDKWSIDELRAIRNSVVKLFSQKYSAYRIQDKTDWLSYDKYHNAMSGTVMVIDSRIWDLSGEF